MRRTLINSLEIPVWPLTAARLRSWAISFSTVLLCTLIALWVDNKQVGDVTIVLIYLLCVVAVAVITTTQHAIVTAGTSVVAYNYFFIEPRYTLSVADPKVYASFVAFVIVGTTVSVLMQRYKIQLEHARRGELDARSLAECSHSLSQIRHSDALLPVLAHSLRTARDCDLVYVADLSNPGSYQYVLPPVGQEGTRFSDRADNLVAEAVRIASHGVQEMSVPVRFPHACILIVSPSYTSLEGVFVLLRSELHPFGEAEIPLIQQIFLMYSQSYARCQAEAATQTERYRVETEQMRSLFLTTIAHDFRTPLAVIQAALSALALEPHLHGTTTLTQLIAPALFEAERLSHVVHKLLDYTRVELGTLQLQRNWEAVSDIVASAMHYCSTQQFHLQTQGLVSWSVSVPIDLPLLSCDALLIEQVLRNLIENAFLHAHNLRQINIEVTFTPAADGHDGYFVFHIRDDGEGQQKEHRGSVSQTGAESKTTNRRGSYGIGLPLCRGIIAAHGGIFSFETTDHGTHVFFTLPYFTVPRELS